MIVLACLLCLGVVVASGVYLVVQHLNGNITGVDISKHVGKAPKEVVPNALNVLVMGDDTRKGQGPQIGGFTPGLSDTVLLLHLSADRKFAYGVSLPRDAMVQRPSCDTTNGVAPGGLTQFNAAYAVGGPACTIKTVQALTNIKIDHFVVVRFRGFRQMVDALGGVTVCLPKAVSDPNSNIYFPAGTFTVDGEQALNYVREREAVGDGSDIGRIKRQQAFIAAMINKVVSAGTLANPIKLYNFLDAATKSLVTDKQFANISSLVSLADSLKNIGLSHIKFITVPIEQYPLDHNRVMWGPTADQLWQRIRDDKPLGPFGAGAQNAQTVPGAKSGSKGGTTTPSDQPSSSPSQTQVDAANSVGLCA